WWYNHEHYHSGIAWHHPADVHHGRVEQVHAARADVLSAAYARNPERFVRQAPTPPAIPTTVWINQPHDTTTTPRSPRPGSRRPTPRCWAGGKAVAPATERSEPAPSHRPRFTGTPPVPDRGEHRQTLNPLSCRPISEGGPGHGGSAPETTHSTKPETDRLTRLDTFRSARIAADQDAAGPVCAGLGSPPRYCSLVVIANAPVSSRARRSPGKSGATSVGSTATPNPAAMGTSSNNTNPSGALKPSSAHRGRLGVWLIHLRPSHRPPKTVDAYAEATTVAAAVCGRARPAMNSI